MLSSSLCLYYLKVDFNIALHLRLVLCSDVLISVELTKAFSEFHICPICAICSAHLILFYLTNSVALVRVRTIPRAGNRTRSLDLQPGILTTRPQRRSPPLFDHPNLFIFNLFIVICYNDDKRGDMCSSNSMLDLFGIKGIPNV
jgi:hypothetical protein